MGPPIEQHEGYMSLRLNLYGFKLQKTIDALGSKDAGLLDSAVKHLVESLNDDSELPKAKSWLYRLVSDGYLLRRNRDAPTVPDNGELLLSRLETQIHVFVLFSFIRAVEGDQLLDLSNESSWWHFSAIDALYNEMRECGFVSSKDFPKQLFEFIPALSNGTPLFGDGFRSNWSFYTVLENKDIGALIDALQIALKFERQLPAAQKDFIATLPAGDPKKNPPTHLSGDGQKFIGDLSSWLSQIYKSGQDAFVIWC